MSGFVYLWYDRKHKRFYLGKHWGLENDGYICSSKWMKRAYKRRPDDFHRKILERVDGTKLDLTHAEKRWGSLIKKEEFGTRYYNLHPPGKSSWQDDDLSIENVSKKISKSRKGIPLSPEQKAIFLKNRSVGLPRSEECRAKISSIHKGRPKTAEHRKKISENNSSKRPEVRNKLRLANLGKQREPQQCLLCGKFFRNLGPHRKSCT